jgi:magnesium chelatase family protein
MTQQATVRGAILHGVKATPVTVVATAGADTPLPKILGMRERAASETIFRLRCAFAACKLSLPHDVIVSLEPNDVCKADVNPDAVTGTSLDAAIAVAILACTKQIAREDCDGHLFVGAIGMNGSIYPVRGSVAYERLAKDAGLTLVVSQAQQTLSDARAAKDVSSLTSISSLAPASRIDTSESADASDETVCRLPPHILQACMIAACGRHSTLIVCQDMDTAREVVDAIANMMPPLTDEEREEVLAIRSCLHEPHDAALRPTLEGKVCVRTVYPAQPASTIIGGGRPMTGGAITDMHRNILYLEDINEFPAQTLRLLRPAMAERMVRIVRANGSYDMPADVMLVASTRPCPCGNLGNPYAPCTCSAHAIQRYRAQTGGAISDTFEMRIDVPSRLEPDEGTPFSEIKTRIEAARAFARDRRATSDDEYEMTHDAQATADGMARRLGATPSRIMRVARTAADLEGAPRIRKEDVCVAASFRFA